MTETLFVCVPGVPVGKQTLSVTVVGGFARKYSPTKTKVYEAKCREEATLSMRGRDVMTAPVELKLQVFLPIPTSWSQKKQHLARIGKIVPTKKPDTSNVLKAVEDGFKGVVWIDDCYVVDHHMTKRFSDTPCVMVQVTALDLLGTHDNFRDAADLVAATEDLFV